MKYYLLTLFSVLCLSALPLCAQGSCGSNSNSSCSSDSNSDSDDDSSDEDEDDDSSSCSNKNKNKDRLGLGNIQLGENNGGYPDRWTCIIDGPRTAVTIIKLSAIISISKQTYMLEGAQKILEVTIDTQGNNSIRFYCLSSERTNRAMGNISSSRELADKYTGNSLRLPAKKYPEATHSHNIEYQVSSPEQLHRIYESATHAWVKDRPACLRVSGK